MASKSADVKPAPTPVKDHKVAAKTASAETKSATKAKKGDAAPAPAPAPVGKMAKLQELLKAYTRNDNPISAEEYHRERARILAEPGQ